jgi:hypothetical protein
MHSQKEAAIRSAITLYMWLFHLSTFMGMAIWYMLNHVENWDDSLLFSIFNKIKE